MRINASPHFFQTHNNNNVITNKKFPAQKYDLTVILDPNIFFIMHNGMYYVHPIIKSWLESAKANTNINHLHVYLLSIQPGPPILHLGHNLELYSFPLNELVFDMLHPASFDYIKDLWNGQIHMATLCDSANKGISDFTDGYNTDGNDIIVISANTEICDFFTKKNIVARCMNAPNLPIMSKPINHFDKEKLAVYCDFDGTLFNINDYIVYRNITSCSEQNSENQNPPSLLQLDTIHLLQQLQKANTSIYLLTQRTYKIDKVQPSVNNAMNIVDNINKTYHLSIQASEASYLNSHEQIEKNAKNATTELTDEEKQTAYLAKIEALYQRIKDCPEELRPKHIMLIDDDLREILKFYYAKPHYEKLNIKLHTTLIMKLAYYHEEALKSIELYDPDLYQKIKKNHDQELAKLESGLETIKIAQGNEQIKEIMDQIRRRTDL